MRKAAVAAVDAVAVAVAVVTIDRPGNDLNAVGAALHHDLTRLFPRLQAEHDARMASLRAEDWIDAEVDPDDLDDDRYGVDPRDDDHQIRWAGPTRGATPRTRSSTSTTWWGCATRSCCATS